MIFCLIWLLSYEGSIPSLEEHWCRHSCCSCPIADTKQNSGDSCCTLRTIVLFQRSPKNKHPMPSNPFELAVALFFQSSVMIGEIKSFKQPLKLQFFQLLMKSASGDLASDEVLLMTSTSDVLHCSHLFFRCFKLPSC